MASNIKYWKSVEELDENSSIVEKLRSNEFVEQIPVDEFLGDKDNLSSSSTSRRDFLKYVGFSTAAASLAACEGPVVKSIPYVLQPEQIIPGIADYYATTMADGFDFANILIKTREGRPIKVENNTLEGAKSGANARVHASVLSLYDSLRLKSSKINQKDASWVEVSAKIKSSLEDAKAKGERIVVLTNTTASPSTDALISDLKSQYQNVNHVVYDAVSESNALDAFESVYGVRALANYDLSKSDVIVAVGADFLGDWQGGGFDAGYAQGRVPKNGKMSKHIQIEANMSLAGAKADKRIPLTIANQKQALVKIYNLILGTSTGTSKIENYEADVVKAAQQLKAAGSKGVLLCGLDDVDAQMLTLAINNTLSSESFNTSNAILTRKGNAKEVNQLVSDLKAGKIHTLLMSGVNPAYTLSNAKEFVEGLNKTKLSVAFSMKEDETSSLTTIAAATPHYLESWGDVALTRGNYSIQQPTINPLFNTKQFQEVLLSLTENPTSYHDYLKAFASNNLNGKSWNQTVHDGFVTSTAGTLSAASINFGSSASKLAAAKSTGLDLVLYTKIGLGDGQQANNPWLQEFPDPITRVSWDNYVTVSKKDAEQYELKNWNVANGGLNGSYTDIKVGTITLKNVPVIIQPGQAVGTIGLAFGYGKKESMKTEMQVGVNAYQLYTNLNANQSAVLTLVEGEHEFACVQLQNTLMGRGDIIKETTLSTFVKENSEVWNPTPMVSLDHKEVPATTVDLWESFDRSIGHHFNLSIDLNACTGCGACVIACHAENNVPVVGKDEIRRSRDVHWLRIDRYYSHQDTFAGDVEEKESFEGLGVVNHLFGDGQANAAVPGLKRLEDPSENPQIAFQPVMCQHCNHAPCETVCPVAATSHSRQGQNQMAYNRCVGTRYCANNCPYKVRRFNWFLYNKNSEFDYHMNDDLGRMVLNPDVNVRSRGVMEKCSMCIQMTQKTILDAKRDGREIKDGEFQTACSSACTSGAMVFGDVNDKEAKVTALADSDRMYHLLESVGTKPNVFYHVKVSNDNEKI
ncbi:TAT-variant-translocated molybdopterin oxidoreductase [uncultured Flavobacterium sp.]|uniref:TAT-variant-translocated molybdopterin oxidoreductase n=1 Tax=uncultured Flavobacterium sp. TaxID=165435 RepID=UPI0030CA2397